MNSKLLHLMKEAGFVFWEDEDWKPEDAIIDWAANYDKEIEKFAELIVRECVDVCNRVYFDNYPDAEDFERSEEGDAIRKHFGVEK